MTTRQFDVVANPDPAEAAVRPYLVVLQSDLVSGLTSTVVAPLVPIPSLSGAQRLNPTVTVDGQKYWLATHELFAIENRILRSAVTNLNGDRYAIIGALDLLFTGV